MEFGKPHTMTGGNNVDARVHNIQPFLERGMAYVFLSYSGKVLVYTKIHGVHMPQLCIGSDGLYRHGYDCWHNVPEDHIAIPYGHCPYRKIQWAFIGSLAQDKCAAFERKKEAEAAKAAAAQKFLESVKLSKNERKELDDEKYICEGKLHNDFLFRFKDAVLNRIIEQRQFARIA
jgi:hypothetical protein